jgi:WD40 repeat protein
LGSSSDDIRSAGKVILIRTKNRESHVDTRVMDISVIEIQQTFYCSCACSDGQIRILSYTLSSKKFKILHKLKGENHCITKVQLVQDEKHIRIFATTSNGYLLFWNLLIDIFCDDESFLDGISPIFVHQVRQCAVMSMKVWKSSAEEFYFLIGDDGCSVSLWKLKVSKVKAGNEFEVNLSWSKDQLQRGAVIGLSIHCDISNNQDITIFSCSNDQVICHWDLQGNLLGSAFGGVSDCQGFIVSVQDDLISVFGDGMSWITCP